MPGDEIKIRYTKNGKGDYAKWLLAGVIHPYLLRDTGALVPTARRVGPGRNMGFLREGLRNKDFYVMTTTTSDYAIPKDWEDMPLPTEYGKVNHPPHGYYGGYPCTCPAPDNRAIINCTACRANYDDAMYFDGMADVYGDE